MRTWFAVLALSALALGCSGNEGGSTGSTGSTGGASGSSSGGGGSTGGGGCTVTVSGAVSKTLSCIANGGYSGSDDKSSVAIAAGAESAITLSVDGQLSAQTYDGSNAEITANLLENGGQATWLASTADGEGSGSVVITSVTTTAQSGGDSVYAVHGTATATLVPSSGAGQNVTLDVTF